MDIHTYVKVKLLLSPRQSRGFTCFNYPFHFEVGCVMAMAGTPDRSTGQNGPWIERRNRLPIEVLPLGNPNGILRMQQIGWGNSNHLSAKMNCPELIEKLALGNVISKELVDRMLGAVKDATPVADNDVKPVLLVKIDSAKLVAEHTVTVFVK